MGIEINPTIYKIKVGETLEIKFNNSLTYGYLYGVGSEVINSISVKDGIITFPAIKKKGNYEGCYIGGYVDKKWSQSNKFNISVIENSIVPLPTTEENNYYLLKLSDKDKKQICLLKNSKEIKVERELKTGDEKLSFSYPIFNKFYKDIVEESYIRTKENEYIVKEIHEVDNFTEFTCVLNIEDLEGKPWDRYESIERNIIDALNLAIVGTGWRVGNCNITKKRTVRKSNCSSWDIIQDIKKTYMVDMQFDCINKKINIYEHLGSDKGTYFIDSLNIKKLETQRDSYQFYTRLIPIGKDGLTIKDINNGKEYVENYQYSNKIKTFYWKDDRYTVVENLKKDAQAKLNELSKPRRAYKADIINLAKSSKGKYKILDYSLGDTITIISKTKRVKEKQRIVKNTEYLLDHSKDTVEIANTILSFEEMQQELQDAAETVSNITTDNGTVDGSTVDSIETKQINDFKDGVNKVVNLDVVNASIKNLSAEKADIQDLNVVRERVGTLEATSISTTELKAVDAKIDNLESTKATIVDLNVTNEKVKVIEADTGNIKTLLNGNLSSENIQSGGITSDKLTIFDAFIKNAMIDSIDINKMNAGTISTEKFNISSNDGNLTIKDNTIQIKDSKNIRVQIGKNASNNYGIYVWDDIGKLMFSSDNGLTEQGIKNKIIRDDMISDEANIQAYKLDINSVFREMNNNSNTLNATRIKIDSENQTLDMAFSKLKTTTEENKKTVENALTKIEATQGEIKATIENSKIIEDKQKTLEDNYNRSIATIDSINNELGTHKTILDTTTGKISNMEVKTNTLEKDLSSVKETIHETKESFDKNKEYIESKTSTLEQSLDSIKNELSSTTKNVSNDIENLKNKTVSVENNLNGIDTKISNIDLTTKRNNEKIIEQQNKINEVEQKVTADAITNTVLGSQTYLSDLGNKVSIQDFTQMQQTNQAFMLKIQNSGGVNKVKNSAFNSKDYRNWSKWGSVKEPVVWKNNEQSGHEWACKIVTTGNNEGIMQQITGLEYGKVYTFSCKVYSEQGVVGATVRNAGVWNGDHFGGSANTWGEVTFTFEAKEITTWLYIGTVNEKCTTGTYWVTGIQIIEGAYKQPWSQYPNENYSADFQFDNEGLSATFEDGSYTKMGRKGFSWYTPDGMNHAYHCLMKTGYFNVGNFGNGNWTKIKIQLPSYFKGKYFEPSCAIQGFAVGQTNLDTLTAQVESYNIEEASFIIQVFAHCQNGSYHSNINITWSAIA